MFGSTRVICRAGTPSGDEVPILRRSFGPAGGRRVALVAGLRGDGPEGIRVAHSVAAFLEEHGGELSGRVDVYPCVNPLGALRGTRTWPFFDKDLNRCFPGRADGHAPERVARALVDDLQGVDLLVEVRGARTAFTEAPQAQVREFDERARELARSANVQVVWARRPGPAAPSTLVYQFRDAIVLEGGTGNRITAGVGETLTHGVLNLLNALDVLPDAALPFHWAGISRPALVHDEQVHRLRAGRAGLFLPGVAAWDRVEAGQAIGRVVEPVEGTVLEAIAAPVAGRVLAIREQPVVAPGALVARIVEVEGG